MGIKFNKKQLKLIEILCDAANGDLMNCATCFVSPYKKELGELRQMFACEGMDVQTSEKDLRVCDVIASAWISVKKRLPDKSGEVLIFTESNYIYVSHYKKERNLFTCYGVQSVEITDIETTHWMPLPAAPN